MRCCSDRARSQDSRAAAVWIKLNFHERSRPPHNLARSNLKARFGVIAKARGRIRVGTAEAPGRIDSDGELILCMHRRRSPYFQLLPAVGSPSDCVQTTFYFCGTSEREGTANQHLCLSACPRAFACASPASTAELAALKRSVAEVGTLGRNINQIARAVNQEQWPSGPNRSDLMLF